MIKKLIEKGGKSQIYLWGTLLVLEILSESGVTVLLPQVKGDLMDNLVAKHAAEFYHMLPIWALLLSAYALLGGFKRVAVAKISSQVRVGMSKLLTKHWVVNQERITIDNPDGRIAEDIRLCTDRFFEIASEVVISMIIVLGLVVAMLKIPVLLYVAFAYILLAFLISRIFKGSLVGTKIKLQAVEQSFRSGLMKIKDGRGDHSFKRALENVRSQYVVYMVVKGMYKVFFEFKNVFGAIIPLLVLFPAYVKGDITTGNLFAGVSSFDLLVINATVIMGYYTDVTDSKASFIRVKEFLNQGVPDGESNKV